MVTLLTGARVLLEISEVIQLVMSVYKFASISLLACLACHAMTTSYIQADMNYLFWNNKCRLASRVGFQQRCAR
jgi:hypothetical protein